MITLWRAVALSMPLLCALTIVCSAIPAASAAEPSAVLQRYAGTYRYVGGEAEIRELDQAIDRVVSKMSWFVRGIARRRLRKPNLPSSEVGVFIENGQIRITRPGRPEVSAPADGKTIDWRDPDSGDVFRVNHGIDEKGVLYQRFEDDRSRSRNRFSLSDRDERLTIETTINAKRLPAPLGFKTTYERAQRRTRLPITPSVDDKAE